MGLLTEGNPLVFPNLLPRLAAHRCGKPGHSFQPDNSNRNMPRITFEILVTSEDQPTPATSHGADEEIGRIASHSPGTAGIAEVRCLFVILNCQLRFREGSQSLPKPLELPFFANAGE